MADNKTLTKGDIQKELFQVVECLKNAKGHMRVDFPAGRLTGGVLTAFLDLEYSQDVLQELIARLQY